MKTNGPLCTQRQSLGRQAGRQWCHHSAGRSSHSLITAYLRILLERDLALNLVTFTWVMHGNAPGYKHIMRVDVIDCCS